MCIRVEQVVVGEEHNLGRRQVVADRRMLQVLLGSEHGYTVLWGTEDDPKVDGGTNAATEHVPDDP